MGRLSKIFDQAKEEPTDKESTKERNNEIVNLNFKVDVETRRKLKQYAAKHDLSLKEVFELAINFYIENNP
jgi:uncharacterized pyridoxamine 5'-phosphate oxidase family protein